MPLSRTSPAPEIKAFQESLQLLHYNVGRTGADGILGQNSLGAAYDAAEDFSLAPPDGGLVPDATVQRILQLASTKKATPLARPPKYIDLTAHAAPAWRRKVRPWKQITGGTLHQTGCPMPDIPQAELDYLQNEGTLHPKYTPNLLRWAKHLEGYDEHGAPIYVALKAHFGITYSGLILAIHPENAEGWHAQSLSYDTFGIEVAGFFAGVEGNPATIPSGPSTWHVQSITDAQIESAKALLRYEKQLLLSHGSDLTGIYPHRIAAPRKSRRPDIGSKGWQRIALPLLRPGPEQIPGLSDGGPGYHRNQGDPIPLEWDPSRVGIHY